MSDHLQRKAVFLDRDGTLNHEVDYLSKADEFRWIEGAPEALARLHRAGLLLIVVTNQSGVARGLFSEQAVDQLHDHLQQQLAHYGVAIDAFYHCPFHPEGTVPAYRRHSWDRKPNPGMFERAVADHGLDPTACFAVGDRNRDLRPALALGMRTILVRTGYGNQEATDTVADEVVDDITAATDAILTQLPTTGTVP